MKLFNQDKNKPEPKWKVTTHSDTGKDDDYYEEWFVVESLAMSFRCENEDNARWLCNILNKYFENI